MKQEHQAVLILGLGGLATMALVLLNSPRPNGRGGGGLAVSPLCGANSGYANPIPSLCGANSRPAYGGGIELPGGFSNAPRPLTPSQYPSAYPPGLELPGGSWRPGAPILGREPAGLLG